MLRRWTLIAATALATTSLASAADIYVAPGQSIQAAIAQAVAGDRVLVLPGAYQESIDFLGKDIQVIGLGGAAATILDGAHAGVTLVTFQQNEPPTAVLSDFTIRDASTGIRITNFARPNLRRLIVEGHKVLGQLHGGCGIDVNSYQVPYTQIEECIVRDNEQSGINGYLYEVARSVISGNQNSGVVGARSMRECLITGNVGVNGGGVRMGPTTTMVRCVVTNNTATKNGGGLYSDWIDGLQVSSCEIAGNHAGPVGGGIYASAFWVPNTPGYSTIKVVNCLIHDNTATSAAGMYAYADKLFPGFPTGVVTMLRTTFAANVPDSLNFHAQNQTVTDCVIWNQGALSQSTFSASFCDIEFGYAGTNNVNADPLFVDAANGDYHLSAASPCIGAGSGTAAPDFEGDAAAGVADIGGDEFAPHLYVPGLVSSGGPITINAVGTPGAPVLLFASMTRLDAGVPTAFGSFALVFPLLPGFPISIGPIPSNSRISITTTVPSGVPVGTIIHMQAFVGGASPALTLPLTLLIN